MLIIRVCVDLVFCNLLYIQFDKIIYISIKICVRVCACLSAVRICDLRSAQPLSIITPSIWPCELAHSMLQILRAQTRVVGVVCFVAATRHDFTLKQCSNALHGVDFIQWVQSRQFCTIASLWTYGKSM